MAVKTFESQEELEKYLAEQKNLLVEALAEITALTKRIAELEKKLNEKKASGLGWFNQEK